MFALAESGEVMGTIYTRKHDGFHFLRQLYATTTFDGAFDVYDQQAQDLGFEGMTYAFAPKLYLDANMPVMPILKISNSRSPAFIKHYIDAGFEKDDFTIQAIIQGRKNRLDWWEEDKKNILSKPQRKIIITAKEDYKIHNGITIPTMNNSRGSAGSSVISSEKNGCYQKLVTENFQTLETCAQVFHEHVMSNSHMLLYFLSPILDQLTKTERQLLPFLTSGKPMKSISLSSTNSQKYAEKLVSRIRKKFGNINKGQLIYYIGLLQILDDL